MKFLKRIAVALCLALTAPAALAQSLPSNATPAQIVAALGLDGTSRKLDAGNVLCFEDKARNAMGDRSPEKLVNLFAGLESLGFPLDDLMGATACDLDDRKPLIYVFSMSENSSHSRLSGMIVPALGAYARQAGKGDAWLQRVLNVKGVQGLSIYDDYAAYRAKAIKRVRDEERNYRAGLAQFTPHARRLFGPSGLSPVQDLAYFGSYYGIRDPQNFLANCIGSFRGDKRRAAWVQNAALYERGQFQPRGMSGGADLAAIQACLKEPDMEAKMRAIDPAFSDHEIALEHKKDVAFNMDVMKQLKGDQPKLCPSGVGVALATPYCAQDYRVIMARLELMTDNARSGFTVAGLDAITE